MPSGWGGPLRVCGRAFDDRDLDEVRTIIAGTPPLNRRMIARRTCEALRWAGPSGRLKEMSCRVALLKLDRAGLIILPPPKGSNGNRVRYKPQETVHSPAGIVTAGPGRIEGLGLRPVRTRPESALWNEAVSRFHYLGFRPLPGAQMRYLVEAASGLLGVIGFGASAWKAAPRDRWIGWSAEQREKGLYLIVNNARFVILPWVRSKNLASWVLSRCAHRLPSDFDERYGYKPVLLETFVQRDRFLGTCYHAANWIYVGDTQGRGKLDRHKQFALPVKRIYVHPLRRDFRGQLCR